MTPMKPPKTKAQMRAELDQAIAAYQSDGGEVQQIPRGLSGNPHNVNLFAQQNFSGKRAGERTQVNDAVQALEARKQGSVVRPKKPRRVLLKDDFGEPLRWVWEDQS